MSTGGYKLVKFSWVGGRSDTQLERTNFVLTGIVDAIINSGTGWTLDSDWGMTTTSDYKVMKACNDSSTVFGVNIAKFLKSPTGNRMMLGYASKAGYFHNDDLIKPIEVNSNKRSRFAPNGLYFSMINNVSDNWINDSTYGIRLPVSALRIVAFGVSDSSGISDGYLGSFIIENGVINVYTYNMILKSGVNQICFIERNSGWSIGLIKAILVGDLVKLYAHNIDHYSLCSINLSNNICFTNNYSLNQEADAPFIGGTVGETFGYINQETNYTTASDAIRNQCQLFDSNGVVRYSSNVVDNAGYTVSYSICNREQLGINVCLTSITGGSRWCPIQMFLYSSDPSICAIIPGDGFKGYLDTDLIRGVTINVYSRGQLFGNDNEFVYLGGGIALGWDSNNTESIF